MCGCWLTLHSERSFSTSYQLCTWGRTQTDYCNSCFSLDLQIKDPATSDSLRQELIAAKKIHLEDAIRTRRVISKLIKSVKKTVAPNDPPLLEEPIFIPDCFKAPYDSLNRPFVVQHQDGTVGEEPEGAQGSASI